MSKFVSDEKVACVQTVDGELLALTRSAFLDWRRGLPETEQAGLNVVWIAGRMGFARHRAVMDALIEVENRARAEGGPAMSLNFGAHQVALLRHNILGWDGPEFDAPFTQANTDRLDPNDPLIEFVLAEISRRNPRKGSPDPKSTGAPGSDSAGAPPSNASSSPASPSAATTTST